MRHKRAALPRRVRQVPISPGDGGTPKNPHLFVAPQPRVAALVHGSSDAFPARTVAGTALPVMVDADLLRAEFTATGASPTLSVNEVLQLDLELDAGTTTTPAVRRGPLTVLPPWVSFARESGVAMDEADRLSPNPTRSRISLDRKRRTVATSALTQACWIGLSDDSLWAPTVSHRSERLASLHLLVVGRTKTTCVDRPWTTFVRAQWRNTLRPSVGPQRPKRLAFAKLLVVAGAETVAMHRLVTVFEPADGPHWRSRAMSSRTQ
jgi:hypothetical protein